MYKRQAFRDIVVNHKPHIRFINPHTESDRSHNDFQDVYKRQLYDYNSEISGIVKEIEAYMQSPASGLEVAHKYVERLSVGNLSLSLIHISLFFS